MKFLAVALCVALAASAVVARPQQPTLDDEAAEARAKDDPTTTPQTTVPSDKAEETTLPSDKAEDTTEVAEITTIVPDDSGLGTNTTIPTTTASTTSSSSTTTANTTTTTESTNSTTTTTPSTTTTSASTNVTTTGTTSAPNTTVSPTTPAAPDTGKSGGFSGWSFFGGMVLALVGVAIGFLSLKYWRIRKAGDGSGGNYNRF